MLSLFAELAPNMLVLLSLLGVAKQVLVAILAVLNGILAILATLAVWKSYLLTGAKILLTLVVFVPIVGVIVYLVWGQKKVRETKP